MTQKLLQAAAQGDDETADTLSRQLVYLAAKRHFNVDAAEDLSPYRIYALTTTAKPVSASAAALSADDSAVRPDDTVICELLVPHYVNNGRMEVEHWGYCPQPAIIDSQYLAVAGILESTDTEELKSFYKSVMHNRAGWMLYDSSNYSLRQPYAYQLFAVTQSGDMTVGAAGIFNKKGAPYPVVSEVGRPGTVPFPLPAYHPQRTPNYPKFDQLCAAWYEENGWDSPPEPKQNHHIKPARWGGEDIKSNCYQLTLSNHQLFNNWWGSGNNNFETPVSH